MDSSKYLDIYRETICNDVILHKICHSYTLIVTGSWLVSVNGVKLLPLDPYVLPFPMTHLFKTSIKIEFLENCPEYLGDKRVRNGKFIEFQFVN
jgi:hypothetical protein